MIFQNSKKRDITKQKLCKENNVYLIIVPYFVKEIETFIKNEYSKYEFLTSVNI